MVNLQGAFIVKICEIFQIVEQAFFLTTLSKTIKAADQTFKIVLKLFIFLLIFCAGTF